MTDYDARPTPPSRGSTRVIAMLALGLTAAAGCSNDDPIVGSGVVAERVEPVAVVEQMRVSIGFETVVIEGEPRQIVIRGEDNLIDHIVVEEIGTRSYELSVPSGVLFEQHEEVVLEVPFEDMVSFTAFGENIEIERAPH